MLWSAKVRLDFVRLAPGASAGLTLTTKALVPVAGPPVGVGNVVRKLPARGGKSVERANPETYALPDESTAMPLPPPLPLPPRCDEESRPEAVAFNSVTKASPGDATA